MDFAHFCVCARKERFCLRDRTSPEERAFLLGMQDGGASKQAVAAAQKEHLDQ
jgi:hypothetical protein